MSNEVRRGSAEMVGAMLISGTIGWFVLMSGQAAIDVVFWRCVFGAATLALVCGRLGLLRPGVITLRLAGIAALGGAAIVLNWVLLFAAFPLASISISTAVYNTQPFMLVGFGALFFGERLTLSKLGWLGIAFAGVLLIVEARPGAGFDGSDYALGIALALGAAFFYALAAVVAKRLKGTPPHLIALIQVTVGIAMLAPLADFGALPRAAGQWTILAAMGVVHTGVMYILLYGAIQKLPTHLTGSLSFIYPIAAIVVDIAAFGHHLALAQVAGAGAILLGAAGMNLGWRIGRPAPRARIGH